MALGVVIFLAVVLIDWGADGITPGEGKIAFFSNRTGTEEIYTIDPDGTNLRRVTSSPTGSSTSPAWSPDGQRLTYLFVGSKPEEDGVYVIDTTGENKRQIATSVSPASTPFWLPTANSIVYGCGTDICTASPGDLRGQ